MELAKVAQILTKNHIPVFGVESKGKSKKVPKPVLSLVNNSHSIAERAYYKAEARGFEPGHELEDWLAAEAEVNQ